MGFFRVVGFRVLDIGLRFRVWGFGLRMGLGLGLGLRLGLRLGLGLGFRSAKFRV